MISGRDSMNDTELVELFHKVGELKKINRSGWIRHDIPEPESVADHSFRTAFIAMILGDMLKVDKLKLVKMALIHDLAEVLAGDITPHDGMPMEEKLKREEASIVELLNDLPNGDEYIGLWKEYEEQESREAVVLKNIDIFERALQAAEYHDMFPDKNLSEFIPDCKEQGEVPEIESLLDVLKYHKC
jgi:5'-deoxynucleotidase YfbR-like HD superfamily hydrolase